MVSITIILAAAALKTLQSQAPEWQRDIDNWIQNDIKAFLEFKNNVFKTIENNKHVLGTDGYEKL